MAAGSPPQSPLEGLQHSQTSIAVLVCRGGYGVEEKEVREGQ